MWCDGWRPACVAVRAPRSGQVRAGRARQSEPGAWAREPRLPVGTTARSPRSREGQVISPPPDYGAVAGPGLMIRNTVRPPTFFSGKKLLWVLGSTATTWAFGPTRIPPAAEIPAGSALNTDTIPDSVATY